MGKVGSTHMHIQWLIRLKESSANSLGSLCKLRRMSVHTPIISPSCFTQVRPQRFFNLLRIGCHKTLDQQQGYWSIGNFHRYKQYDGGCNGCQNFTMTPIHSKIIQKRSNLSLFGLYYLFAWTNSAQQFHDVIMLAVVSHVDTAVHLGAPIYLATALALSATAVPAIIAVGLCCVRCCCCGLFGCF